MKLLILLATVCVIQAASPKVAPYVDVLLTNKSLVQMSKATGLKAFTLAFVVGGHAGCVPMWGGKENLSDPKILKQVKDFKAIGGQVIVATGGALGPYLESVCPSVDALYKAYMKILDTVGTTHLDIDIEATVPLDRVNQALAKVQKQRPSTTVSYTLAVQSDDYGLTSQLGVDVIKNAVKNGVRVDIVNPMAMEFWTAKKNWGDAVVNAANSTLKQMQAIWPKKKASELNKMLGVTPMIGSNFNRKQFLQAHGRQLVDWAKKNQIGLLAFWSMGRDNGGCANGNISPTCSGVAQSEFEFAKIFAKFQ